MKSATGMIVSQRERESFFLGKRMKRRSTTDEEEENEKWGSKQRSSALSTERTKLNKHLNFIEHDFFLSYKMRGKFPSENFFPVTFNLRHWKKLSNAEEHTKMCECVCECEGNFKRIFLAMSLQPWLLWKEAKIMSKKNIFTIINFFLLYPTPPRAWQQKSAPSGRRWWMQVETH